MAFGSGYKVGVHRTVMSAIFLGFASFNAACSSGGAFSVLKEGVPGPGGPGKTCTALTMMKGQKSFSPKSFSKGGRAPASEYKMNLPKLEMNLQAIREQNPRFDAVNALQNPTPSMMQALSGQSTTIIPAGTALAAFVDNSCQRLASGALSVNLAASAAGLDIEGHSIVLEQDTSLADLEKLVTEDLCVVHLANNAIYRVSSFSPNDPRFAQQTHFGAINGPAALESFYEGGIRSDVELVYAVVDTGLDYNHNDLKDVMWSNSQGHHGYDFVDNDTNPKNNATGESHATHVAGLTAAQVNNSVGGSGIIGSNVKIMSVRVLGTDGSGTLEGVADGIRWAANRGADVINLSLGAPSTQKFLLEAIEHAVSEGAVVFVAAGNDGNDLAQSAAYPAAYGRELEGVITIGSTDAATKKRSSFSNYNPNYVELGAPGSDSVNSGGVLSTLPNNAYGRLQGTSMASPVAAGGGLLLMAVLQSYGVTYTPARIETLLYEGSSNVPDLNNAFKGGKHLDLRALLTKIKNELNLAGVPQITSQPCAEIRLVAGEKLELALTLKATTPGFFAWKKDDQPIAGGTDGIYKVEAANSSHSGAYVATVTNLDGSTTSSTFRVTVVAK